MCRRDSSSSARENPCFSPGLRADRPPPNLGVAGVAIRRSTRAHSTELSTFPSAQALNTALAEPGNSNTASTTSSCITPRHRRRGDIGEENLAAD